jgi:hypothetical protein
MCYMMAKQQYLSDDGMSWHPHVMFFVSGDAVKSWGANLPGSPVIAANDPEERVTIFMVLAGTLVRWDAGPSIHDALSLFTSLNVTIGQCMVLLYLVLHEKLSLSDGATGVIAVFVVAGSIDTLFRMADAASIVNAVRAGAPHAKSEAAAPAPGPED